MLETDWENEDDIDWETLEDESVRDTLGDDETVNERLYEDELD